MAGGRGHACRGEACVQETATEAGITHATGMHSCFNISYGPYKQQTKVVQKMQMTEEQTASLRHRARVENDRTKLSKYGASREPPKDDAVFYPEDDTHSFFARVNIY